MATEKVLSLYQPWATLIVIGAKWFETRSWSTNYRGPLLIHASKNFSKGNRRLTCTEPFKTALEAHCKKYLMLETALPMGVIIGKVELVRCFRVEDIRETLSQHEKAFGNYENGRYAWQLMNAEEWGHPIPAKGSLGIWNWSDDAEKAE